jgi:DNA-binding NarL/FixJ family response regulator
MQDLQMIKILVVDYRALVGSGISTILGEYSDFKVIGQAKSGKETLQFIEHYAPDVVCIDIDLPDPVSGMEVIRMIRSRSPQIRIVILTNVLEETIIHKTLQEGVTSYLLKNSSADELVRAIRAAYQGIPTLSPEVTQMVIHELTTPNGYHLTPREHEVLERIARGLNNHEIAKELNISLSTVQFHTSNIFEKLDVHNRIEAATFAVRHNLAYPRGLANVDPWSANLPDEE